MRRVSVGGLGRPHGSPGVAPARLQARAEGGSRGLARDLLPCEYVRPEARMCATMTIRVDNARGRRRQDTGRSDHHRGMGEELPRRARRAKPSQYNERRRMDHRLRSRGDRRREADQTASRGRPTLLSAPARLVPQYGSAFGTDVESRSMSAGGGSPRYTSPSVCDAICSIRRFTARRPTSPRGSSTAVSGGLRCSANQASWMHTRETSSGIDRPDEMTPACTPSALVEVATTRAVALPPLE